MSKIQNSNLSKPFSLTLRLVGSVWLSARFEDQGQRLEFVVAYRFATPLRDLLKAAVAFSSDAGLRQQFAWDGASCRHLWLVEPEDRLSIRIRIYRQTDFLNSKSGEECLNVVVPVQDFTALVYQEVRALLTAVKYTKEDEDRYHTDLPVEEFIALHTLLTGETFGRIQGWNKASRYQRLRWVLLNGIS
jgi:hypothetical protein